MLYEISKELQAHLDSKEVPFSVVYGPELDAGAITKERIVIERDRDGGDTPLPGKARTVNPTMIGVRAIGAICRIFAKSNRSGARVQDHERRCDQVVDKVEIGLHYVCRHPDRRQAHRLTSEGLLSADALEMRGLSVWPGVVYEIHFEVDRAVNDTTNWVGDALDEVAIGGVGGVSIVTSAEVSLANDPDGTTPETGCGS